MNCLVCVKQVPDTDQIQIDPVTHTLRREGVPAILNPYDGSALELSLIHIWRLTMYSAEPCS